MTIAQLQPGERFRLPYNGRTGLLVRLGDSGARVKYDGKVHKHVRVVRGGELIAEAEFDAPGKATTIALGTEVERIS